MGMWGSGSLYSSRGHQCFRDVTEESGLFCVPALLSITTFDFRRTCITSLSPLAPITNWKQKYFVSSILLILFLSDWFSLNAVLFYHFVILWVEYGLGFNNQQQRGKKTRLEHYENSYRCDVAGMKFRRILQKCEPRMCVHNVLKTTTTRRYTWSRPVEGGWSKRVKFG